MLQKLLLASFESGKWASCFDIRESIISVPRGAQGVNRRRPPQPLYTYCNCLIWASCDFLLLLRECLIDVGLVFFRLWSPLPYRAFKEFICWLLLHFIPNCQAAIVDGRLLPSMQFWASLTCPCLTITTPIYFFAGRPFSEIIFFLQNSYLSAGCTHICCYCFFVLFFLFQSHFSS